MVKPKQILNQPANAVSEFIEGLLIQYPNHLRKLENHHVLLYAGSVSSTSSPPGVQLISGGGSGHEPSHAGWLGHGMLSGAVCGGIFASPSVSSILATIRVLAAGSLPNKRRDILLIIKNYTGDRLNFGMAAEMAGQEGIHVKMVVVADDCALPRTKGITGARGVAGTVFVHKIAGAAAANGLSLEQVQEVAQRAARHMGTLGFALDSVTIPGADLKNDRLDEHTIEIGLGIHGEAGLKQSPLLSANELAKEMVATIQSHGRVVLSESGEQAIVPLTSPGDEVVVLVNNLGGTSNFELSILARECVQILESSDYDVKALRVFVGSFMTSFDMHGASLTILNVTGQRDLVQWLDSPTNAPAWSVCDVWNRSHDVTRPSATYIPEVVVDSKPAALEALAPLAIEDFAAKAKSLTTAAATKLAESEALLTKYDTIVGDGDCGITMARGANEILSRLKNDALPLQHPVELFSNLADAISGSMGGTSGVLLELMFRKMSSTLANRADVTSIGAGELSTAFQRGVEAVSLYGGAQVGSRTMLDALVPAAAALVATQRLEDAAAQARQGADGTALMKAASAGRSNYLAEETLVGTPDPGACAVALVLESMTST